jgi:hypothetical protein
MCCRAKEKKNTRCLDRQNKHVHLWALCVSKPQNKNCSGFKRMEPKDWALPPKCAVILLFGPQQKGKPLPADLQIKPEEYSFFFLWLSMEFHFRYLLRHFTPRWTTVRLKSTVFWDITPCNPLNVNRRFGGTYRLHLQCSKNNLSKKPGVKAGCKHVICSSETSVDTQRPARRYIPPLL